MAEILKKELDTDPQKWDGFENGLEFTGRRGSECPICGSDELKYNEALELVCSQCGAVASNSFSRDQL